MHEISLIEAIVEHVEKLALENKCKKIDSITLSIGKMSGVDRESIEFCFAPSARGSILEKTNLILEDVPFEVHCNSCHKNSLPDAFIMACSHCGSIECDIIAGDKFLIKSIEFR